MPAIKYHYTTAEVNGMIYAIGNGYNASNASVEVYNPSSNQWTNGPDLLIGTEGASASVVDGIIYTIGGTDSSGNYLSTVQALAVPLPPEPPAPEFKLSVLMSVGDTQQLSVSSRLQDNAEFTWSSSDDAIASVDANGLVTANGAGVCDITATRDGVSQSISIRVIEEDEEFILAVDMGVGSSSMLFLTDDPYSVEWSSSDTGVATVAADGTVTASGVGLCVVSATINGTTFNISVRVR